MAKHITRYNVSKDCIIIIIHYDDDVATWIVRKYKRILFWKKRTLSVWFNDAKQAMNYSQQLKAMCEEEITSSRITYS